MGENWEDWEDMDEVVDLEDGLMPTMDELNELATTFGI